MREKTLEQLFNLYTNRDFERIGIAWEETEEYKIAYKEKRVYEENFRKTLTPEQNRKYNELSDLDTDREIYNEQRIFSDAFKLAQLILLGDIKTISGNDKEVVA